MRLAVHNAYPILRRKFCNNHIIPSIISNTNKIYRNLNYVATVSFKIAYILKLHNIKAGFYNTNSLMSLLVNNKFSKKDRLEQSDIYQLNCNCCSCF